jgi:hypothetical protein
MTARANAGAEDIPPNTTTSMAAAGIASARHDGIEQQAPGTSKSSRSFRLREFMKSALP